ncbi:MAG: hypothetical protein ACLUD2_01180 [Clostridium sp.]
MDTVIKRISEIEQSAVAVMDDAAARKKAFAAEMEEKTRRFDQTADEETEKAAESPTEMETRMNLELSGQKAEAEKQLAQMEKIMSFTMKLMWKAVSGTDKGVIVWGFWLTAGLRQRCGRWRAAC